MRRAKNPRVEEAERAKEAGNNFFTAKPPLVHEAVTAYSMGLAKLDESGVDNEPEPLALRCTLLQNRAACRLQLKQYASCQQDCNEVLAFDKTRAKARYRRGLAYEGLGCYDDALKDLQAVYASDTSLAVEDAVDRVELRKALRPLQCEWGPSTLTVRVEVEESAHSVVMRRGGGPGAPSREDMNIIQKVVSRAFDKVAAAVEKRGRRPSATTMKLLGMHSGDEEVDFARAKCVALAYRQAMVGFSEIYIIGCWFKAADKEEWLQEILCDAVKDTPWAQIVRERGGLPGRFHTRIPGQPDVKEVLPPARAAPAAATTSRQRSSSGSSGSGSGSVTGTEEPRARGGKPG